MPHVLPIQPTSLMSDGSSRFAPFLRTLACAWRTHAHAAALYVGQAALPALLAAWQAWRDSPAPRGRLHLVWVARPDEQRTALAACAHPLATQLHLPEAANVPGLLRFETEKEVVSTLAVGEPQSVVGRLGGGFDGLWVAPQHSGIELIRAAGRLMREGGSLVATLTDQAMLQGLRRAGFTVAAPEQASVGQAIEATFLPRWRERRQPPPVAAQWARRQAVVIGAGLAGCAVAHRLAARGWQVTVLEREGGPARLTSAHHAAALHPHVSPDDSHLSRLTRAGHHYALAHWAALSAAGHAVGWHASGLLQAAMSEEEAALQRRTVEQLGFPPEIVRWVTPHEAQDACGAEVTYGGWWFGLGGWVAPPAVCVSQLADAAPNVTTRWNCHVASLRRVEDAWQLHGPAGELLASVPVVILANGGAALELLPRVAMTLSPMAGRLTDIPAALIGGNPASAGWPRAVVSGNGYVLPADARGVRIGSTYETPPQVLSPAEAHAENLTRIAALLPAWRARLAALDPAALEGYRGVRWVTHNRLPHIGSLADEAVALAQAERLRGAHLADLPRLPGLYGLLGLASRGLTWAALGGELLASQIEGEPWPIERDLAGAVDPARELLHRLRHGLPQGLSH